MPITEFIREYNIPKTKLYAVLKENSMTADDVREPSSPHISNKGMQTLANLFGEYMNPSGDPEPEQETPIEITIDQTAAIELAVLRERVTALERENELLRDQLTQANTTAEEWKKLFTDMHETQQRLLESPRPSLWGKLFGRRKGNV